MSDVDNKVKMIVEGLLLASRKPLTLDAIANVFSKEERPDKKELSAVMEAISEDCNDRGFELKQVASGFRFQVKQELSEWIAKLWEEKPPRYTRALLETLALVAYRQPITRGDIEEIRGVGVSPNIIRTLLDREWIRIVGHRDVPGRPAMFATTRQFLDYFNLKSLQELPPLSDIKELGQRQEPEADLGDNLANLRILELPAEAEDGELPPAANDDAELVAEEEAAALAKKPLDEILKMGVPDHLLAAEPDSDSEDESGAESQDETGAALDFVGDSDHAAETAEFTSVDTESHAAATEPDSVTGSAFGEIDSEERGFGFDATGSSGAHAPDNSGVEVGGGNGSAPLSDSSFAGAEETAERYSAAHDSEDELTPQQSQDAADAAEDSTLMMPEAPDPSTATTLSDDKSDS